MSKIAVIGSGITGLVTGIGLLEQGHDVTIFSALSADDWMTKVPPTGTAARFARSLDLERELGIMHWEDTVPMNGIHLTFCPTVGRQLIDMAGNFDRPGVAVDVRIQSKRWTEDFEARGGRTVIGAVDVPQLDKIAQEFDLTLVAAGKADIGRLFEVDESRTVYDAPQRKLVMIVVRNPAMDRSGEGVHATHTVKFNFFATEGEQFSVPYLHRDGYPCWNCIFEAKEGKIFDVFDGVKSGEEAVDTAKTLIRKYIPWDWDWFKDAQLADKNGWLKGSVRPCVKNPVGTLPSGAVVMAIGDTANTVDPIGGQGANNCYRQIRVFLDEMKKNVEKDYSGKWMKATFDRYFDEIGEATNIFNNTLLEPLTAAGRRLLIAQYGSTGRFDDRSSRQKIANAFANNFDDPNTLTSALHDEELARDVIDEMTGGEATRLDWTNKSRIALGQFKQVLGGRRSDHPLARMRA